MTDDQIREVATGLAEAYVASNHEQLELLDDELKHAVLFTAVLSVCIRHRWQPEMLATAVDAVEVFARG